MKNKFHTMLNERVKLSYLPGKDEYQVEIIPTPSSLDRKGAIIKIPSHILDELHNRAWKGDDLGGDPVNPFGEP